MRGSRRGWTSRIFRGLGVVCVAGFACLSYSWLTLPDVRPLRTSVPEATAFMRLRATERSARRTTPRRYWVPYNRISPLLRRAVLVAEDAAFWDHDGVDLAEVQASLSNWANGSELRGGSTITQQLAKNLYLSPSRDPYRKVVELLIARRLEAELPKVRILELYLNLIEWGDDVWGAEAAARVYFGQSASTLSAEQAALLAGAIINPRVYSPAAPNRRLLRRQQIILRRMGVVRGSSRRPAAPSAAGDGSSEDAADADEPVLPVRRVEALDPDDVAGAGGVDQGVVVEGQADVRRPGLGGREEDEVAGQDVGGIDAHPDAVLLGSGAGERQRLGGEDVPDQSAAVEAR